MGSSEWIAVVAILAGLGTAVFTQIWQSWQEERRTTGQRWLEERRVAYSDVLSSADRELTEFGHILFLAFTKDWENFRFRDAEEERAEATAGPQPDRSSLQGATSALELIAPPGIRAIAEELRSGAQEFEWRLTIARAQGEQFEESAARDLFDSHEELRAICDTLAEAMRADVNGKKRSRPPERVR